MRVAFWLNTVGSWKSNSDIHVFHVWMPVKRVPVCCTQQLTIAITIISFQFIRMRVDVSKIMRLLLTAPTNFNTSANVFVLKGFIAPQKNSRFWLFRRIHPKLSLRLTNRKRLFFCICFCKWKKRGWGHPNKENRQLELQELIYTPQLMCWRMRRQLSQSTTDWWSF